MIITGLRGVGKTVLLNEFVDIAKTAGWQVIEFEASKRDDNHFRQAMFSQLKAALLRLSPRARWTDRGRRAAEVLTAFAMSIDSSGTFSVSWDIPAAEGLADHHDLGMDLTDALLAIGEAAQEQERGVALLIDEVQFLKSYAERLLDFPELVRWMATTPEKPLLSQRCRKESHTHTVRWMQQFESRRDTPTSFRSSAIRSGKSRWESKSRRTMWK